MNAGTLELQLLADVARLKADVDRMQGIVSRGAQSMQKALDDVRGTMQGLFGGVSAAGFGMWIKSAIDFADELNDLNKTTNVSISRLSGLALMSKQTGSDLTGMAQAMNKLTLEMGKAPEKFARIGVTAKDPLEAFKQFADIFKAIEDPQLRAAVAAEALGKGWAAAAPALSEGSKAIEEMVKRGEELAGITAADAMAADEFNDRVSELQIALRGTATVLARDMLPLLTELVSGLTDVTHESKQASGGFNPLTETLRAVAIVGGNVAFVLRAIGIEIGGVAAQIAAFARGDFAQIGVIHDEMVADAERNRAAFDAWEKRILSAGSASKAAAADFRESERAFRSLNGGGGAGSADLRGFIGDEAGKKAAEAAKKELEAQKKLIAELAGLTGSFAEDWDRLNKMYAKGVITLEQLTDAQAKLLKQQPFQKELTKQQEEATKRLNDALEEEAKLQAEVNELLNEEQKLRANAITSAQKQIDDIEFETRTLRMTNVEREKAIALRELERNGIKQGSKDWEEYARKIAEAIEQREAVKEHQRIWESIDRTAQEVWTNVFEGGEDAFKRLGRTLKAAVLDLLYQLTIKKWIVQMQASFSGSAGSPQGGLGGLFGGGGVTPPNPFATGMDGFSTGFMGSMNAGGGLIGGFGSNMSSIGSAFSSGNYMQGIGGAMPYVGMAAAVANKQYGQAAGTAIGSIWGPVGAMIGGAIGSMIDQATGGGGGPKTESGFGLGVPHVGDQAGVRARLDEMEQQYANLVGRLGGKTRDLDLGFFTSQDPQGTALTQLQVAGAIGGNRFYDRMARLGGSENVGRSDAELQEAIAEEVSRVMLEALQESDLPGSLGEYVRSLGDLDKLAAKEIQKAITVLDQRASLEERIYQLTASEEEKLIRAREREVDAVEEANRALVERVHALEDERAAAETLKGALAAARDSARAYDEFIRGVNVNIRQYIDQLNGTPAGGLSPEQQLMHAREAFNRQLDLAKAGDRTALEGITGYADTFIEAQRGYTANSTATFDSIAQIKSGLMGLPQIKSDSELIVDAINDAAVQTSAQLLDAKNAIWTGLWGSAGLVAQEFKILDASLDGLLSFDELAAALGPLATDQTIRDLIAIADTDGDGQLSKLEAIRAAVKENTLVTAAQEAGSAVTNVNVNGASTTTTTSLTPQMPSLRPDMFGNFVENPTHGPGGFLWADVGDAWPLFLRRYLMESGGEGPSGDSGGIGDAAAAGVGGGGFAVGTNYVPYDMTARIHEGERIVPRWDNPYANPYTSDGAELAGKVDHLTNVVQQLMSRLVEVSAAGHRGTINGLTQVADNTQVSARAAQLKAAEAPA